MPNRFKRPEPVMYRLQGERKDINPNYPCPEEYITAWQKGLLKLMGDINPLHFSALWTMCSRVNANGTTLLTTQELVDKHYVFRGKFKNPRFFNQGYFTQSWVLIEIKNGMTAKRLRYRMNPCLLKGELPAQWKPDGNTMLIVSDKDGNMLESSYPEELFSKWLYTKQRGGFRKYNPSYEEFTGFDEVDEADLLWLSIKNGIAIEKNNTLS